MNFKNGTVTFKNGSYTAAMKEAADVRRGNKNRMMRQLGTGAIYAGQEWTLLACDGYGRTDNEAMEFYSKPPTKKLALELLEYAIQENPKLDQISISTYNRCYFYDDQDCFRDGNSEPWEISDEQDTDLIVWIRSTQTQGETK